MEMGLYHVGNLNKITNQEGNADPFRPSERFHRPEMSHMNAETRLRTNVKLNFHKKVGLQ